MIIQVTDNPDHRSSNVVGMKRLLNPNQNCVQSLYRVQMQI